MNNFSFNGDVQHKNMLQARLEETERFGGTRVIPLFKIDGMPKSIHILFGRLIEGADLQQEEVNEYHKKYIDVVHVDVDLANVPYQFLLWEMSLLESHTADCSRTRSHVQNAKDLFGMHINQDYITKQDCENMRGYESHEMEYSASSAVFFAFTNMESSLAQSSYHAGRHISKKITDDAMLDDKSEYIKRRKAQMVTYNRQALTALLQILAKA
jgi:hypothetical protein